MMGTSRNDRSPDTPNWKPVLAVIGNSNVEAERQNLEIWRAAVAENGSLLERSLGGPLLVHACRVLGQRLEIANAVAEFDTAAREANESTFISDLTRRAFIRSSARNDSSSRFIEETFSEIVTYYASRDLPSYIGASGRISDVSQSVDLKKSLQNATKEKVSAEGRPPTDFTGWKRYVARVLAALQKESAS
jgi:hypothetical protein